MILEYQRIPTVPEAAPWRALGSLAALGAGVVLLWMAICEGIDRWGLPVGGALGLNGVALTALQEVPENLFLTLLGAALGVTAQYSSRHRHGWKWMVIGVMITGIVVAFFSV